MMKPQKFNEQVIRPQLEERLESIISGAALLADSLSTREDRRDRIVQECNAVRQALQELLDEYIQYVRKTIFFFFFCSYRTFNLVEKEKYRRECQRQSTTYANKNKRSSETGKINIKIFVFCRLLHSSSV